jgi:8-oxo-dGTP pyrophosphatase MutT (NUDIX family)
MVKKAKGKRHRRDVSAGVIVFHRSPEGCRFLLLRSRLTRRPLWEFPKGGVDEGETLEQAALRELREETGLAAADVRFVDSFERAEDYRFTAGDGHERTFVRKRVTYYLAEALRTEITISPEEASRFAWFTPSETRRRLRYKARRAMLDEAMKAAGCAEDGDTAETGAASKADAAERAQPETSSRKRDTRRSGGRRLA